MAAEVSVCTFELLVVGLAALSKIIILNITLCWKKQHNVYNQICSRHPGLCLPEARTVTGCVAMLVITPQIDPQDFSNAGGSQKCTDI